MHSLERGKRIPIAAARRIAKDYGYDQVIVIGRLIGEDGKEHVTTYGKDEMHCDSAGAIGKWWRDLLEGKKKVVDV